MQLLNFSRFHQQTLHNCNTCLLVVSPPPLADRMPYFVIYLIVHTLIPLS